MISEGRIVGDGSWELHIFVTDLNVERVMRVKSDLHIGGVMLRLVDDLDVTMDWSDHALWWPKRNTWLTHTKSTLDQYGVTAAAELEFTPMHKTLRVQLPDLRHLDLRVDFSVRTFRAVIQLCKELGIRHPEEMSLCKPISNEDLKQNYVTIAQKQKSSGKTNEVAAADTNSYIVNKSHDMSNGSLNRSAVSPLTPRTPINSPSGTYRSNTTNGFNSSYDESNEEWNQSLANSPISPPEEMRRNFVRPKNLYEKARMNVGWLDSSLSILEQGIKEFDTLLLRYKYLNFYDLNAKYDAIRINQIYEQAKWAILNEELECTEEEMVMFGALQLQVNLQMNQPQPDQNNAGEDDIERLLNDLQTTLEGTHVSTSPSDITHMPELKGFLKIMKPRQFTFKKYKSYYFICKDLKLTYFKSNDDPTPIEVLKLQNCEATPDVSISQQKYGIKLEIATPEGMTDYYLRCSSEDQYAHWMAAIQLASKGKTLADSSYNVEVKTIKDFLSMQKPSLAPVIDRHSLDIRPENYLAPRFVKKIRGKAVHRILEAHANVKNLTLVEAKMQFIRAWQALPDYGIALFLIKQMVSKKEELVGISFNRIMLLDPHSGDHIRTWRYGEVKAWNVNWEKRHMMIQFRNGNLVFSCLTADSKVIHEFIGGYIFLSMRTKDANQTLDEELFHKLTCGRM